MSRLALACLLAATLTTPATPAAPVAPGCPASRPTWVGGTFRGSDGRAVNTHLGVVLTDGNRMVRQDGSPFPPGTVGYSFTQKFNPTVPATGTTDPSAVRTWGACVAANVVRSFIEIYPKRPTPEDPGNERTDYSRYGPGVYYYLTVTPGATLDVLLRLPVIYQQGGNTGGVQGYITRSGRPLAPEHVIRVRMFTHQRGATCGIEGMAIVAHRLLTGATGRTYYLVDYVAAGQCGATYQTYSLRVTCGPPACGSSPVLIIKKINVVRGRWPRVDIRF